VFNPKQQQNFYVNLMLLTIPYIVRVEALW